MNSRGPIMLITNNFKIKSKNNHSGIIYTYTVDFIDGENVETFSQPLPTNPEQVAEQAAQARARAEAQAEEDALNPPTNTEEAEKSASVSNPEEEETKGPVPDFEGQTPE